MRYFLLKNRQFFGNPLLLDPVGLGSWGLCHKIYRHKKSISVSCFCDRDGDSNHTPNFILSKYILE